jgi:hypothetical protein
MSAWLAPRGRGPPPRRERIEEHDCIRCSDAINLPAHGRSLFVGEAVESARVKHKPKA